jgi:hypothetical protein
MGQKGYGDRSVKPKARSNDACRNYIMTMTEAGVAVEHSNTCQAFGIWLVVLWYTKRHPRSGIKSCAKNWHVFSCATASLGMCQKHVPEACLVWSSCCSGICVQVLQPLKRFSGLCLLNLLCVSVVLFWHKRWLDAAIESIPKIWHLIWNFMALLHVFWCVVAPECISEASSWRKRRVVWRML